MAKDAKAAEAVEEAAPPPKKNRKLLIIIAAAVFLLAAIGGGAAYWLAKKTAAHAEDETAEEPAVTTKKARKAKESHPIFVSLEPFTVNLVPETGDQYLQVTLSLELDEASSEAPVKLHMPKIRNNVTLLLSGNKASQLLTKEGKEKLAQDLKAAINDTVDLPPKSGKNEADDDDRPVKEVLFTSFIIQ